VDVHTTEQEQIEALKKWWKENGNSIVVGVLLGVSALLAGKAWFGYRSTQAGNASTLFVQMLNALDSKQTETARKMGDEIETHYSGTGYAVPSAMALARMAVEAGDLPEARTRLEWAVEHSGDDAMRHTARQRLLRVLIDTGDYAAAQAQLDSVKDQKVGVYQYGYTVLRGDLALAQGKTDAARDAYKTALDTQPSEATDGALVRMKYENLIDQPAPSGEEPVQ